MAKAGEHCLTDADALCGDPVPCVPLRAVPHAQTVVEAGTSPASSSTQLYWSGHDSSAALPGKGCVPPSHLLQVVSSTWQACRRILSSTKRRISFGPFFMRDAVVLARSALFRASDQVRNKLIDSKRWFGSTRGHPMHASGFNPLMRYIETVARSAGSARFAT